MTTSVGLIGLGDIVRHHVSAATSVAGYDIVAACDQSQDRLEPWQRKIGCQGFADYRELLAVEPDVVVVALPHALHAPVSIEAMEAGCHVIVEKPMAVSVAECRQMLAAARRCQRTLLVSECACFSPGVVETGRRFARGDLGRFLTGSIVNARCYFRQGRPAWFLDPRTSGGGMFCNVGVHRLAVARGCLPGLQPMAVTAAVAHLPEHPVEACISALVRYEDGGAMLYEEIGYFPAPEWMNTGTHFAFEQGIVAWDENTWRIVTRDGKEVEHALPDQESGYATVYRNMLRAMQGQPYAPQTWEFAVDAMIAQAAYASARTGETIDLKSDPWRISATGEDQ